MADIKKPTNARHAASVTTVRTGTAAAPQGDMCVCGHNEAQHDSSGCRFGNTHGCNGGFAPKGEA